MKDLLGIVFDMFFSELCKIMVNGVTFVGFRGSIAQTAPLEPPLIAGISYFCRSSKALRVNMVTFFNNTAACILRYEEFISMNRSARKQLSPMIHDCFFKTVLLFLSSLLQHGRCVYAAKSFAVIPSSNAALQQA